MTSDSTSRSSSSSSEDEEESKQQSSNQKSNTNSIDNSLDAIENQLSSISFTASIDETTTTIADYNHETVTEVTDGSLTEIVSESVGERRMISIGESSSSRGTGLWMKNVEVEVDVDGAMASPSSSGYAGERGSSGSVSVTSGCGSDGVREVRDNGSTAGDDGVNMNSLDSDRGEWISGKRHADEVCSCMQSLNFMIWLLVLAQCGEN